MIEVLYIPAWDAVFENSQSRKLDHLRWIPTPNKQDGDGYTQLIEDHPNGAAHFGAWNAIAQAASKCDPRGTLIQNDGTPHTALSLKRKTKIPVSVFDEAIPRLLKIGWLATKQLENKQVTDAPHDGETQNGKSCQPNGRKSHTSGLKGTNEENEGNGMERTEREEVVVVLGREGFKPDDPIFDDPKCTLQQAMIAIDNANARPPKERKPFIATAIQRGYELSRKAAGKRELDSKKMTAKCAADADRKALEDTKALDTLAPRTIAALPVEVRNSLAEKVLQIHPGWRGTAIEKSTSMSKAMFRIYQENKHDYEHVGTDARQA